MDSTSICLDTGLLIAYLKGRDPGASAVEQAVKSYRCYVTSITVYELLFGVARAQKQIGEEDLLSVMEILPLDATAARRAAVLHDELIRRNQDIGVKDVLIAATCLIHDLPVLTYNDRHFSRVTGLTILTPHSFLSS